MRLMHLFRHLRSMAVVLFLLCGTTLSANEYSENNLWQTLKSGDGIAIMRHALAPGTGDPVSFTLDDCQTQRNLSERGREQSREIGRLFRQQGIEAIRLFSSQWCRCLETARLMDMGEVAPQALLNSFFRQGAAVGREQTGKLQQWLSRQPKTDEPLVLVTHQVNITGLTHVFPSSGEIVIIQAPENAEEAIKVLGTIETL